MTRSIQEPSHSRKLAPTLLTICGIITVALLAGLGLQFQPRDTAADDTSSNITTVNTVVAELQETIEQTQDYPGVVKAPRMAELSFDRPGRVTNVLVSLGTTVSKDTQLAKLESRRLESRQESLQSARGRAAESLAQLEPDSATPTAAGMQSTIQQLRTELNQLASEVAASRPTAPGQPPDFQSLQQRLQAVESRVGAINETSRQKKINELRKLIDELDGQLADVAIELESCTLTSPFAGIIAKQHVDDGTVVSAGMPIFRLLDTDSLEVWLGIPADLATQIGEGQTHGVRVNNERYQGVVTTKLPEIDRNTRTRTVILQLDAPLSDKLLPGDVARVELSREIESAGFWLPLTALMREAQGLWSVFVVDTQGAEQVVARRYVEVIHLENNRVFVRGTLSSGELVIPEGTHRVAPGQSVRGNQVRQATETSKNRLP